MSAIVILTGKVGRDVDLRSIESDGRSMAAAMFPVVTFERAFNKASKTYITKPVYHRCVAYGKVAENIGKLFTKGKGIQVTGSLQYREYEKNGQRTKITEILVDRFFFTDGPEEGETAAPVPAVASPATTATPAAAPAPAPQAPAQQDVARPAPLGYSLNVSFPPSMGTPKPAAQQPAPAMAPTPAVATAAVAGGGSVPASSLPVSPLGDDELANMAELEAPF